MSRMTDEVMDKSGTVLKTTKNYPKVSVIVSVYNCAPTVQRCLDSIFAQTYPNIETIIIDGGSSDGTVDIIKSNTGKIAYWESKPDRGIYHAWNKALTHANGKWICFIGADDLWAYPGTIQDMIRIGEEEKTLLVSGKIAIVDDQLNVIREKGEPWNWKLLKRYHCIAHPGMMHLKECFEKYGSYNESFRIAGDYEFSMRMGPSIKTSFIARVFVLMGNAGVSRTQVLTSLKEVLEIQKKITEIGLFHAYVNFFRSVIAVYVQKNLNRF